MNRPIAAPAAKFPSLVRIVVAAIYPTTEQEAEVQASERKGIYPAWSALDELAMHATPAGRIVRDRFRLN